MIRKKKLLIFGIVIALALLTYSYYPMLNIITGYAAKNMASGVFLANRDQESFEQYDNDFFPISLAECTVDMNSKTVTASLFGLMKRKAIYREGLGAILMEKDLDTDLKFNSPNRSKIETNLPFPYGNLAQIDTVFKEIAYDRLNKAVDAAFDEIGHREKETRSVLVVYKDHILAEKYEQGFDKESLMHGWSMTKSFASTMYGILEKKYGFDIHAKVDLERWQGDKRKEISYHNLLQMNSGLEWDESYFSLSDITRMLYLSDDMGQVQLDKPLTGAPNESWNYSSGTTNLLSGLLLRQQFNSHQEYLDFWYQELFDKIGMNSMVLEIDAAGNYISSSYSWGTSRDWARFGLLYLHEGNWNGEQIIDSSFVKYVSSPTPDSEGNYGAQFWLNSGSKFPDAPLDLYYCSGFKGQFVFIIPSKELVIVRTGLAGEAKFDINEFLQNIVSSIEE